MTKQDRGRIEMIALTRDLLLNRGNSKGAVREGPKVYNYNYTKPQTNTEAQVDYLG